ncbi:NAD-dependent epimerase/dehydratase family protein [Halorubrum ezzemoulense]|uniref:NAD-dependent epimerase/dehydratase family protein n=1 Tax=Halorubrum ezzemoulense TaxID=337243 RepID=UPI002330BCA2|nr:NAD-dependent epimerase/dehydratase family protein [Halorubrum ezzemoulense]MDB9252934.1 NAD-dependent epimerase/dehydratase family protein [Halorubrum ezzemoulense]MDB9256682.1 NAD-dependent epimerase/dehydratase family protein [Halorubrum ezzemoulense]MDB9278249.1 NAD-dependent epimerase/dehydratase family protein [Halorubrum ezzemoulense]
MATDLSDNQTVLITGGAGFIGSHLSETLLRDNDVRVFDALTTGNRSNVPTEATLFEADLRDKDDLTNAVAGTDLIFHEAALVSVARSIENPLTSHEINAEAALRLLEAARLQNARVVLASSAAIYGHPESVPITEDQSKEPTSPYGLDKLTLDHYARLYHDRYDLETVALRYFNVYGPRQVASDYSGVISIFIDQALSGENITVHGDGEQTRDFVYIDDVVQANLNAATTDAVGEAYNVGTGESVTIRELAELIQDITDTDSDIVHTDARTGDIEHSKADISKAKADLEYEPTISLREGLEQTIEWYRKQRD